MDQGLEVLVSVEDFVCNCAAKMYMYADQGWGVLVYGAFG